MKKITWQLEESVIDSIKKQAAENGMSAQQLANLILKKYTLEIKIVPVEEKRVRGRPPAP
jgi:predicted DNA binding CopG/RHH family protein